VTRLRLPGPYSRHLEIQRPAGAHDRERTTSGRIRLFGVPVVDLSTGLIDQLQELAASIGGDDHAVDNSLAALGVDLKAAVPSYCGLQLTITQHDFPVVLTAFAEFNGSVATSLRLPLWLLDPALEVYSRVVFYARTPGAFVDLAADLAYALAHDSVTGDRDSSDSRGGDGLRRVDGHSGSIELDADLPPPTRESGLSGLTDLSTINRAVGVMIANGHHPDDAHDTLRRHAGAAGLATLAWAARMLRS
jgi:hypothetical protein